MRISDWSSDVCSSDLGIEAARMLVEQFGAQIMLRHAGDTIVAVDRVIVEEEIMVGIGGGERETVAQRRERNGGIQSDLDDLMHGAIGISGGAWCAGEERQALQLVPEFGAVERNVPADTAENGRDTAEIQSLMRT